MAQQKETARKIAVVGLGYVGLPIAVAFGKRQRVIGFDINQGLKYIKNNDCFIFHWVACLGVGLALVVIVHQLTFDSPDSYPGLA